MESVNCLFINRDASSPESHVNISRTGLYLVQGPALLSSPCKANILPVSYSHRVLSTVDLEVGSTKFPRLI